MNDYYFVYTIFAQVICDDWSEPVAECWRSYVAYPSGAYQGYWEIV